MKCWIFLGLFLPAVLCASPKQNENAKFIEYLTQEKVNLSLAISEQKALPLPQNELELKKRMQETLALIALNKARIAILENFLLTQKKQGSDYSQYLKQLQQVPLGQSNRIQLQEKIQRINVLMEINDNTITLIEADLTLAKEYYTMLKGQQEYLSVGRSKEVMEGKVNTLQEQENQLSQKLKTLFDNNVKLLEAMKTTNEFKSRYSLDAKLLLNSQRIVLTQQKIAELAIQKKIARTDFLLQQNADLRTLEIVNTNYKEVITQISLMQQSLQKSLTTLEKAKPYFHDFDIKQQVLILMQELTQGIQHLATQLKALQKAQAPHEEALKKQLSARQSLTEYPRGTWSHIVTNFAKIPGQFTDYIRTLFLKVKDNYFWQETLWGSFLWIGGLIYAMVMWQAYKKLQSLTQKKRFTLAGRIYDGILLLTLKNLPYLSIMGFLFFLFYCTKVPFLHTRLFFTLFFILVGFRTLLLIARLILVADNTDVYTDELRLYSRIRILLLVGGWVIAFMLFSVQYPLPFMMQDIFHRLFMLFLLGASFVSLRSREVVTHILYPFLKNQKTYLRKAITLFLVLIPVTLLLIATIGLLGYGNLAWLLIGYQVYVLLILAGYIVLRSLLMDLLDWISEWMIASLPNAWLWIEVLLKPLDKILRVLLILASGFILFISLGWQGNSPVAIKMNQLISFAFIDVSGIHISTKSILVFVLVAFFVAWLSRWTRECSYRWLYKDTKDVGIRHSLSVFTQYAVVIIGGFLALHVLGLDFSGMSMVLGGLAVGMGFGLRDFASNIVGGLMLLIERPVREGDLITIGAHEGRVAHIGIRCMRVSSWDNMEVLIPNAETFNKPFTNWTHQDSIVRTVIPIKVSRSDDPTIVQQLVLDVLAIIPEILAEPPAQVFLTQIDEALIAFEARYFINVELHTRFEVRSTVLFAITAQFKAAGIKAPIPPFSIELKDAKPT